MSVSSWWIRRPTRARGVSIRAISCGMTCKYKNIALFSQNCTQISLFSHPKKYFSYDFISLHILPAARCLFEWSWCLPPELHSLRASDHNQTTESKPWAVENKIKLEKLSLPFWPLWINHSQPLEGLLYSHSTYGCSLGYLSSVCVCVTVGHNSPKRVLQVISSGQGNGAEKTLHSRNCVQEQRLWEVLKRESIKKYAFHD